MAVIRNFTDHFLEKVKHIVTMYAMFPAYKERNIIMQSKNNQNNKVESNLRNFYGQLLYSLLKKNISMRNKINLNSIYLPKYFQLKVHNLINSQYDKLHCSVLIISFI